MKTKICYNQKHKQSASGLDKLKSPEKEKVLCGKRHFEITDETLKYEVVDGLLSLKQR